MITLSNRPFLDFYIISAEMFLWQWLKIKDISELLGKRSAADSSALLFSPKINIIN